MLLEVIKKLKFNDTALVLNPPEDLKLEFKKLGYTFQFDKRAKEQ